MPLRTSLVPALTLTLATSTAAFAGPRDAEIVQIIEEAVADWSVFLSCSVLDPQRHEQLVGWWADERADLEDVLAAADLAPNIAAEIEARLTDEHLLEPTTGAATALIEFCANTEWQHRLVILDIAQPAAQVERLLAP
jgi:hypothetical protein